MPGKNLMMARQGSQFAGDGVNLSWGFGGHREISPKPEFMSRRLQLRVANGQIIETDEEANVPLASNPESRVLYGEEAKRVFDEPPGHVKVRAVVRTSDPDPEVDKRLQGPVAVAAREEEKTKARPKGALTQRRGRP